MTRQDQAPRRMAAAKPNTFFGGAAILAMGILVVKVIGLFYKIPLVNIIGSEGSADFNNAYNIYSVLLTISTAGLPSSWYQPRPATPISIWPPPFAARWICQLLRQRGSKVTLEMFTCSREIGAR